MTTSKLDIRRELQVVEEFLARCTARLAVIQSERDRLLLQLCDSDGCQNQRHLGVR